MAKKLIFILLMSGVMLSPMGAYAMDDEGRGHRATIVRPHEEIIRTKGFDEKLGSFKEIIVNKNRPNGTININTIREFSGITTFYISEYNPLTGRGRIAISHTIDCMSTPTQSINYLIQGKEILEGGEARVLDPEAPNDSYEERRKEWFFEDTPC